jgi:uncharacterized protein YoxC
MVKSKKKAAKETKETSKHLNAAMKTLTSVLTGFRQSEASWIDDIEEAHRCLRMSFKQDDEVFDSLESLNIKYKYLSKLRNTNKENKKK